METTTGFRPGHWVRIKSREEIASTLDGRGTLEGLPFMPEMAGLCGQVFRIRSQPGKTCLDARPMQMRTFPTRDVFLLAGARCSGTAHGGCQRECALFWKRQWLESVTDSPETEGPGSGSASYKDSRSFAPAASAAPLASGSEDDTYFCQSTALSDATTLLSSRGRLSVAWWDWRIGNLDIFQLVVRFTGPAWRKILRRLRGVEPRGVLKKTPTANLGLQAGDRVRIKPLAEILPTLDVEGRNRGLVFEPDMTNFCSREFRVRRRVDRMISESSGKMISLTNTVTLEEIVCSCPFTFGGCPRAELQLWREIWLEKIG